MVATDKGAGVSSIHEFFETGKRELGLIVARSMRKNIVREIKEVGGREVSVRSDNMVTMPMHILDVTCLNPEFYMPAVQANMVCRCLKTAETSKEIRRRLQSMICYGGVKANGEFFRLNSLTMAVLRKYV